MPELFLHIERCFRQGLIAEAQKWQFIVNELITELLSFPSLYGACKAILKERGYETGQPRLPFRAALPACPFEQPACPTRPSRGACTPP